MIIRATAIDAINGNFIQFDSLFPAV